ncbi:hypothetical protein A7K73_02635 [Candidatus Methylacidiphilum fumarolicum]|nr:hypothetical protein A7K73_02635 [Candidatus Methylacidiphilum fumarolicum]
MKRISKREALHHRQGQGEAAKVWVACRNMHLKARQMNAPWPRRDKYPKPPPEDVTPCIPKASNRSFASSMPAVEAVRRNRRDGRREIRYLYKDKGFFSLMWPAQAMGPEEKRIVLPMG